MKLKINMLTGLSLCLHLFFITAFAQPGQLDPDFGLGGWVHTDLGGKEQAGTVDVQADGKILVGGRIALQTAAYDFLLLRYLENGELDTSFGNRGFLTWDFGVNQENLEFVRALPNGKILIGGFSGVNPNTMGILIQLLENGSPDPEFGNGGIVNFRYGKSTGPIAAAIDDKQNIVVTGVCVVDSFDIDWFVARFLPNGTPDSSFNRNGWMYHNFLTREDIPFDILVEPNGNILVTGCAGVYPKANYSFIRLKPDGSLDDSFGASGSLQTDFAGNHDIGYTTAITSDGKYLVSGTVRDDITNYDFSLAKYFYNGDLDPGFGNGGKMTFDFKGPVDYGLYMVKQPDNKYLVCGENNVLTHNKFIAVRYFENGLIDSSFGENGLASFDAINILTDHTPHFTIQKDGKIIMVANYKDGNDVNVLVIRWTNDLVSANEDEMPMSSGIRLNSNPVSTEIQLECFGDLVKSQVQFELVSLTGTALISFTKENEQQYLHMTSDAIRLIPRGMYFIKWNAGNRYGSLPMVKL
ncbi:MAG: hypothetical protein IPM34_10730 [Saprospiraceae bacterium]|nr:hypothetical protein [Saprospiraceae bacterium]